MVVWFASGLSLTRWIWPVLSFGLPLVLARHPEPLRHAVGAEKSDEYVARFEKREDLQKVSPGQFRNRRRPTASSSSKAWRREGRGAERVRQHGR
jgi:hypothetical protein